MMAKRMMDTLRPAAARFAVATLIAGAVGLGAVVSAAEKRPLPAFQVVTMDGVAVASPQVGPAGQWLLIYVTPTSAASARLLGGMKQWESPDLNARTVVVIGAPVAEAAKFVKARAAEFPAVRWFADPQGAAWQALRLTGTPYILGVKDGQIAWSLAGVLNDPRALESVIRSWVEPKPRSGL
jgi:hypothetical protein